MFKFDKFISNILESIDTSDDVYSRIIKQYRTDDKDFELCKLDDSIGYYPELWYDECFTHIGGVPDNVEEYIKTAGHAYIWNDMKRWIPANWKLREIKYDPNFTRNTDHGISFFIFDITQ